MSNSIQLPNFLIDYWMPRLSDSQFKVLLAIARVNLSIDYKYAEASFDKIHEITALDEFVIQHAISKLKRCELLICNGDVNSYFLNFAKQGGAV